MQLVMGTDCEDLD